MKKIAIKTFQVRHNELEAEVIKAIQKEMKRLNRSIMDDDDCAPEFFDYSNVADNYIEGINAEGEFLFTGQPVNNMNISDTISEGFISLNDLISLHECLADIKE